jgi:hypothetical protein
VHHDNSYWIVCGNVLAPRYQEDSGGKPCRGPIVSSAGERLVVQRHKTEDGVRHALKSTPMVAVEDSESN